jgi:hypothetical protein
MLEILAGKGVISAMIPAAGHSQARDVTGLRHARPGPAGGRRIHPDGTGVSGSCPAGQERPDFRPLGAG